MRGALRRLQDGQRWWAAEFAFRLVALLMFGLVFCCFRLLEYSLTRTPSHQPTMADFALGTVGVVLGSTGLAFLLVGPGLLRLVPYPRRRLF